MGSAEIWIRVGVCVRRVMWLRVAIASSVISLTGACWTAAPAAAVPPGRCGYVLVKGPLWLPARGGGVDVRSNGSDEGSDQDCASGTSTVNGNVAGEEWQCVELVNRLFLTKGWISATWPGSAGQPFYDQAPSNPNEGTLKALCLIWARAMSSTSTNT